MKKLTFLMALMLMVVFGAKSAFAAQVYTSYDSSTKTLTYYYDDKYGASDRPNSVKYDPEHPTTDRWKDYHDQVTKVVINSSMQNVSLESTERMFCGSSDYYLSKVTSITGLDNLNTSNVTDMSEMFRGCSALVKLDLTTFNTANVTDMSHMFIDCQALTSLDITSFNTAKVTNMTSMFNACYALKSVNLSSFNTPKVETMAYMFAHCYALESVDMAKFRFDNVKETQYMFFFCSNLTTIYCNADLSNNDKLTSYTDMFDECNKLVGGKGTGYGTWVSNHKYYARPDGGPATSESGLFTSKKVLFAEMSGDGTVMYIYYNTNFPYANLDWNADGMGTQNMTTTAKEKITKVSINSSVANALPTTCRQWFYGLKYLGTIEGLEYLNTSECTSMRAMFSNCNKLASLDVSKFNTAKVTNMSAMFYGCEKLTTIDVKNFNTANVTTMSNMFQNCKALEAIDFRTFNTSNVTSMTSMFNGCAAARYAFINFDMRKVANTSYMFKNCSSMMGIYCDDDMTQLGKLSNSTDMFVGCTDLQGYHSTAYNASIVDKTYARPDHGTAAPGYFTPIRNIYTKRSGNVLYYLYDENFDPTNTNMAEYDPIALPNVERWSGYADQITKVVINASMKEAPLTSTRKMFYGGSTDTYLSNVTAIEGLGNLNTSKVDNMSLMFMGCSALETIDVNVLDISNVETMVQMFSHCSSLKTIYCSKNWGASVTSSTNMFYNCTSLRGGNGTAYNSSIKDATYARPDEGGGQAGYFTDKYIYAELSTDGTVMYIRYDAAPQNVYATWTAADGGSVNMPESQRIKINKVVITESMQDARPVTCRGWFYGLKYLGTIEGLEYLNTSECTNMRAMFSGCEYLTSLDVSHFVTDKVTEMNGLFNACHRLATLNVNNFNVENVTNMERMFSYCSQLTTIICDNDWTSIATGLTNSNDMFLASPDLKGGNGTKYDAAFVDATYARQDEDGQPGYFTSSSATGLENVQSDKVQGTKILRDGQLYILRDGRTYNMQGMQVK